MEWNENTLEFAKKSLHYYYQVEGQKPAILFLHGFTDNGLCYERVAEQFIDNFNVFMLDCRGHGQSSNPESGFTYRDYIDDIRDFCEKLHLKNYILMGHSVGGGQAALYAATYPNEVRSVILEDPSFVDRKSTIKFLKRFYLINKLLIRHRTHPRSIKHFLWLSKLFVTKKWDPRDQIACAQALREYTMHYPGKNARILLGGPNGSVTLSKVHVPVLLITSEWGGVSGETAMKYKDVSTQLTIAYVEKVGHNIRRENFNELVRILKEFLSWI